MVSKAAESIAPAKASRDDFYRSVLELFNESKIGYLVGGGHAMEMYSGISRKRKDLDIFVQSADVEFSLKTLAGSQFETKLCYPHWLGKIFSGGDYIDLIFNSGNGVCAVDGGWFEHAVAGEVYEVPVIFCPPEEMIWSKAFVMERERYDGADVAHLIRACAARLDWRRLVERFGPHWRVLLSNLILFGYIYPSERPLVPSPVMGSLLDQLQIEKGGPISKNRVCRGTLLSRTQYRDDVEAWGYEDARQMPIGSLTLEEAANWTAAGEDN
jgi:hypothetical protein